MKKKLFRNSKELTIFHSKAFIVLVSFALIVFSVVPCFASIDEPDGLVDFDSFQLNYIPLMRSSSSVSIEDSDFIWAVDSNSPNIFSPSLVPRGNKSVSNISLPNPNTLTFTCSVNFSGYFWVAKIFLPAGTWYWYFDAVNCSRLNLWTSSSELFITNSGNYGGVSDKATRVGNSDYSSGVCRSITSNGQWYYLGGYGGTGVFNKGNVSLNIYFGQSVVSSFIPKYIHIPYVGGFWHKSKILFDYALDNVSVTSNIILANPILLLGVIVVVSFAAAGVFDRLKHK